MDINGKKAIVFGGTSGIGLSATQMLSDKGAHVIALSRNPDKLKTVPKNVTTKKDKVSKTTQGSHTWSGERWVHRKLW